MSNQPKQQTKLPPIVDFVGNFKSECSLCGKANSPVYMNLVQFSPLDFQKLLDKGWNRIGFRGIYIQNMSNCCPHVHFYFFFNLLASD